MQVTPVLTKFKANTFIQDYLTACGVQNIKEYLHPTVKDCDDFRKYPNMKKAIYALADFLENNKESKLGILVDSDNDGICSSAEIYNFLLKHLNVSDELIKTYIHTNKQHGLRKSAEENIVQQVLDDEVKFLIIPDAGTNDAVECEMLAKNNVQVLILDHHIPEIKNDFAIIVNHHLGENLNTELPGTGVVFKFIQAYCYEFKMEMPFYEDLVASSIVSDICSLVPLENRYFLTKGLSKNNKDFNPMLNLMFEKLCKKGINPTTLAWNTNPLVNSLCRGENQEDKRTFFNAISDNGEADPTEGLKVARRAHRIQKEEIERIASEIESNIDNSHKVIIAYSKNEDKNYAGLAANKLLSKYHKPIIILRNVDPNNLSGSLRSPIPLLTKINESKLAKAMGHEEACGIFIKKTKLNAFIEWCDNLDLDVHPNVPVTAILNPNSVTTELCDACVENKMLWGKDIEEPTFYFKLNVSPKSIFVYQNRTNTVKILYGKMEFVKFFCNDEVTQEFLKLTEQDKKIRIDVIGKLENNEWNGKVTPQCIIDKFEIVQNQDEKEESWEDLF